MHTRFQRSYEVQALVDYLSTTAEDVIPYAALQEVASGADLTGKQRHYLYSARLIVARDHQRYFDPVTNVGLQRRRNTQFVKQAASDMKTTHRRATRTKDALRQVVLEVLDEQLRHKALALQAACAMVAYVTATETLKAAAAQQGLLPPPPAITAEMARSMFPKGA